jgi:hypothetical protein
MRSYAVLALTCLIAAGTAFGPAAAASPELSGAVTARGVGPLRWGATPAQVRAWAGGPPEFTTGIFAPPRKPGSSSLGYHCAGFGGHVCHTVFTFVDRRLVAFTTQSPRFRTAKGARPGMKAAEATRLDPGLLVVTGCPGWAGKTIPLRAVSLEQSGRVWTLYGRSPASTPWFGPSC